MNDKELDKFFRQMVEEPDIPFVPGDWEKMKQKLQSPIPGHKGVPWYKNNLFRSLTAIILLGSAWLAWTYKDGGLNTEVQQVQENQSASSELIISENDQGYGKGQNENEIDQNKLNKNTGESFDGSLEEQKETGNNESQATQSTFQTHHPQNNKERKIGSPISKRAKGNRISQQFEGQLPQNQLAMVDRVNKDSPDLFSFSERVKDPGLHFMDHKEPKGGTYTVPHKKRADYWHDSRWSIAALLSPDVSALKINDLHGLGTSAGLHVEYFVLPQWSITLGGLYSFKTYQGDEGYQTSYTPSPSGVKGDCWVLDVPLNVRFYAIINELDRWYISSGFSSYFMLREKYQLEYSSGYNPYTNDVDVRNSNQHFMGIMNFSLGYERILTPKLSLQVEPYFKLPITEIGEGEVNLKSAGAFIGLKYRW